MAENSTESRQYWNVLNGYAKFWNLFDYRFKSLTCRRQMLEAFPSYLVIVI